ncbi:MAG: bifunctional nuclease family protein [Planctomycetota bacterium]|nr:MAG: bifunctional nuclease family protein [Planctomycetota bacterium]
MDRIPVTLSRIIINERSDQQYIFLKEKDGNRSFPIVIGIYEAAAIDRYLRNFVTPRPLTHDLIFNLLDGLNAELKGITVTELKNDTYYAVLEVRKDGETFEIDSRPSDAITLSIHAKCPIHVSAEVMDKVGALEPDASEFEMGPGAEIDLPGPDDEIELPDPDGEIDLPDLDKDFGDE